MAFLDGKTAIVSGGAQGLGKAFSDALMREGANVTIFDLHAGVATAGKQLETAGGRVLALQADVSKRADCERVVADTVAAFGGIDILVNNAAKWTRSPVTDPWEKALADWDEVMDTNVKGVLILSRLCVPQMIRRGGGDIVNVSTYYVLPARGEGTNPPETDLYNASKWALNGFTDAWELVLTREHNIRVNGLCIGATDTPMLRGLWPAQEKPPTELVEGWMRPEQIARLMIDVMKDGRSGENIGAWAGQPVELGPRQRWDCALRERADFTGRPMRIYGPPPWSDAIEPVEHLAQGRP